MNRVRKTGKDEGNEGLIEWCDAISAVMKELSDFALGSGSASVSAPKAQQSSAPSKGTMEKDGNKWTLTGYNGDKEVIVDGTTHQTSVYIYDCHDSVFQIKGKVTAVTVDKASKVGVLVEDVIASVDIVNSRRSQLQVTGYAPTIVIDASETITLYLPEHRAEGDTSILTSKTAEINVIRPHGEESVEVALPEQFRSVFDPASGKYITEAVAHTGV